MSAPDNPLGGMTPVDLAIAKLDLRAGDVLAVKVDAHLDTVTSTRIREHLEGILPSGTKVMVLDRGVSLSVVRREDIT